MQLRIHSKSRKSPFRMEEKIYDTPAESFQALLSQSLHRLATRVEIDWQHRDLSYIHETGAKELNYLCQKVEAFILYLQLEANFEKLQNTAQKDTLSKIDQVLTEYNRNTEKARKSSCTLTKRSRLKKWWSRYT